MRVSKLLIVFGYFLIAVLMSESGYAYSNNAFLMWGDWVNIYGRGTDAAFDSPEGIARMMKLWKDRGYTGVYWRTDMPQLDPNEVIRYHGTPIEPLVDLAIRRGPEDTGARFNVLKVAREAAEAEGLEFWVHHPTIYSDGAPPNIYVPGYTPWPYEHKYVHDHPEVLTIDRTGKKQYMIREYAYPGARASKVQEFVYIATKSGAKNFIPAMRTEAAQTEPGPTKADQYGFNDIIVNAMSSIYGVNILTDSRFDITNPAWSPTDPMVQNWHALRGGYLTQFYRDLRTALDQIDPNIKIAIQIPGDYVGPDLGNWTIDWRTWVNEGIVDGLIQPVTFKGGWDPTTGKGYLCDAGSGVGVLPVSTYRNFINSSPHPQTQLIQGGGYERFGPALPTGTDGWQTFWTLEAFDIAWYQRWQQWKQDIKDLGYIKFMEQNFDNFQVNSAGYSGAEGDYQYHPDLRACPGAWYVLGDGTNTYPTVQNTIKHGSTGNSLKIIRDSSANNSPYALHLSGSDRTTLQSRVDDDISSGRFTLEFWLYLQASNGSLAIFPQHSSGAEYKIGVYLSSGFVYYMNNGSWALTSYRLAAGQWQKFTIDVNIEAKTYSAYAGQNNEITVCANIPYTVNTNRFNRIFFSTADTNGNVTYLDDVVMKWYPNLRYAPQGIYTRLLDNLESHTVGSSLHNVSPDIGSNWKVNPSDTGGFFIEKQLSFGDGFKSLAATSYNNAFAYSGEAKKIKLDPNYAVTADFDVFLRTNYQTIVGFQKSTTGSPMAAINANGTWKYWNGTSYVSTGVNVSYGTIAGDGVWSHVQISLDCRTRKYTLVIQPCGSNPTLLGTYDWDPGTQTGDNVFFFIKPQGTNGQISYYDNIIVTGPPCVVGDLNGDCQVNFVDFAAFASHWLQQSDIGEFNNDNKVDYEDLNKLVGNWLLDYSPI